MSLLRNVRKGTGSVFVFCYCVVAAADPVTAPTITATLDRKEAYVGDVVLLRITVKHAEADAFEFPAELALGAVEVVDKVSSQKNEAPMLTEELVFKIASYEVGAHDVPAIDLRVGGAAFSTPALALTVKSVIDEEQAEQEAKKPANVQTPPKEPDARKPDGEPFAIYERVYWPFYVLGGALAAAAAYLLAKRLRRRGSVEQIVAQAQIPPHKAALMLLRLLRDKQLLKQGRYREYYFEATEIMRGYLAQRYAINALDLTTAELMEKLAVLSAPGLDRQNLRDWLEHADFVKFAKFEPPMEKAATMLDFFEQQVWATRPPEPKAVEAA